MEGFINFDNFDTTKHNFIDNFTFITFLHEYFNEKFESSDAISERTCHLDTDFREMLEIVNP
jgi:hypothetical protein